MSFYLCEMKYKFIEVEFLDQKVDYNSKGYCQMVSGCYTNLFPLAVYKFLIFCRESSLFRFHLSQSGGLGLPHYWGEFWALGQECWQTRFGL